MSGPRITTRMSGGRRIKIRTTPRNGGRMTTRIPMSGGRTRARTEVAGRDQQVLMMSSLLPRCKRLVDPAMR
eukprot:symbB.v1.2.017183.t1/scaffold1291.1/size126360/6